MSPAAHDSTHPSDRWLSAYHDRLLTPAEEDEIQEHLVDCKQCLEVLLSLAPFTELAEAEDLAAVAGPTGPPDPGQTAASWQAVRTRLPVLPPLGGGEVSRGVEKDSAIVRLGEAPAVLALALPPKASYSAYRFEIRTPRGDLLLTAPAAPVPVAGPLAAGERPPRLLALALSRNQLQPGDYRLRLVGVSDTRGETLAEHALRVAR